MADPEAAEPVKEPERVVLAVIPEADQVLATVEADLEAEAVLAERVEVAVNPVEIPEAADLEVVQKADQVLEVNPEAEPLAQEK